MMQDIFRSVASLRPPLAALLFAGWVLFSCPNPATADESAPLKPIDTSSPRTTLQGFLEFMNKGYATGFGLLKSYMNSSELFPSSSDFAQVAVSRHFVESAERSLDLSGLPPATADDSSRRLAIQLKEILDRIDVPPIEAVPDAKEMAAEEFKRWNIPNSEIRIARVQSGPRAGEYLFTAETVERIPEFYEKIKNLPYKPGATSGWLEFAFYSPSGVAIALHRIVPPRWLLTVPGWVRTEWLDQPAWRWLGIIIVLGAGFLFVILCWRLHRRWDADTQYISNWTDLIRPASLVLATPVVARILSGVLRVSGDVYQVLTLALYSLFFLALTWLVWVAGGALAESVIAAERLRAASIDSQLIRLVLRLLTIVAAVAILVKGADQVGLPAYSVLAGLGVGGLAVALAGQETLANLIGSLIIMIEKPFAVGHWVKVKDTEGVVENVGFRSTRIRTFYDSLVTIPSSQLVNTTVDNMQMRDYRRVKTTLSICYGTPRERIETFVEGVRKILKSHPDTRKDLMHVTFHEFGASSLDILLYFFLKAPNWTAELVERHRIFLDILGLAEALEVRFAFPTQTLHVESFPRDLNALEPALDFDQTTEV